MLTFSPWDSFCGHVCTRQHLAVNAPLGTEVKPTKRSYILKCTVSVSGKQRSENVSEAACLTTPKGSSWCRGSCGRYCRGIEGGSAGGWWEGGYENVPKGCWSPLRSTSFSTLCRGWAKSERFGVRLNMWQISVTNKCVWCRLLTMRGCCGCKGTNWLKGVRCGGWWGGTDGVGCNTKCSLEISGGKAW